MVVENAKQIILASQTTTVDNQNCKEPPPPGAQKHQELEIKVGTEQIAFTCGEILLLVEAQNMADLQGLTIFYYLMQALKCLVMYRWSIYISKLGQYQPDDKN